MTTLHFTRNGRRVTLHGAWPHLLAVLRAWCPGGKVAEILNAEGGMR